MGAMKKQIIIIIISMLIPGLLMSQTKEAGFISLSAENDLFVFKGDATDRYYTNGVRLDYYFNMKKRKFPSSLLLKISEDKNIYRWGIAQYMFTPSRIDIPTIQYNDRPYAGTLFAIHSLSSYDYSKRLKATSEIYLGVMGPLSLAEETQIWVHNLFNYTRPEGWKNQVSNDIVLNYNLRLEKEVIYIKDKLFVTGTLETFNGTLYNAMGAGFVLRVGHIDYFLDLENEPHIEKKKSRIYVVLKPTLRVIYYNALLQGGFITNIKEEHKGYILSKDQIERLNVFAEAGIVYERPKMRIVMKQKMRTAPIRNGNALEIGNISLGFKL